MNEISEILGETDHKVLLIMDGYDQYERGMSSDIDNAIEREFVGLLRYSDKSGHRTNERHQETHGLWG